ncbi:hypothetical protein CgunFtcFv8_026282 [Champsocephalus gunnari]|nr:hypothetical protein CgunFtcFv8_026282 [Champsocephalus gunnari]
MEEGGQQPGVEVTETEASVETGEIVEVIVGEKEEGDGETAEKEGGSRDRSRSGSETGVTTRANSRGGKEEGKETEPPGTAAQRSRSENRKGSPGTVGKKEDPSGGGGVLLYGRRLEAKGERKNEKVMMVFLNKYTLCT